MNTEAAQQKQYPVLVLMGVSGSGKSTVGGMLAGAMGWDLQEGDDLHPQANIDKMATGHPLNDEDRWPWLDKIAVWIKSHTDAGQPGIVTCSALKRSYRDVLRGEHVVFVHLAGSRDQIGQRLTARSITTCPPRCSTPRSRHSRPSTRTNRPSSSTWAGVPPRSRRRSCDAWRHSNTEQARRVSTRGSGYGAWVTAAEEGHDVDQLRVDAQARLEVAVGEGRLTLEEYSDKAAVVWSPTADRGQLEQIVPFSAAPPAVVSPPQATIVGVFGDTKRSGRWSLAKKTLALLLFGGRQVRSAIGNHHSVLLDDHHRVDLRGHEAAGSGGCFSRVGWLRPFRRSGIRRGSTGSRPRCTGYSCRRVFVVRRSHRAYRLARTP